jgi:gliding motility-associated-like protein
MMLKKYYFSILFSLFALFGSKSILAQCPQLLDGTGNYSATPYWVSCTGGNFSLFLQPDINVGNYTISWGDGSPNDNGVSIIPPAFVTHVYPSTVDTFIVTLTDNSNGCVITGVVVMEQVPTASIVIPFGDPVNGCAPASFNFMNNTQNVSQTTNFTWDFGDGSPVLVFDETNAGQTISHIYLPGTVNCDVAVTLTAENYCNQGNPSINVFSPIQVWDIDDAQINATDVLLCYPDTIVDFTNVTNRNCFANGNTAQRYEWWNFGNYWGQGQDSIIGWRPWGPPNNPPISMHYPGIGTYNVMLIDSSYCGLDTAYITIQIVPPPTAGLDISKDTICEGETVTFNNLSSGGANSYFWNFGDGTGWIASGGGAVSHTYNFTGDYVIQIAAFINGGTASCTDTASIPIHVLPSPTANFNFNNNNGCDSLTITFTDFSSVDAVAWSWDFDNGNFSNLQNPPVQFYGSPGIYNVQLDVSSNNGCTNSIVQTINVYQSPVPAFSPTSVCMNEIASFIDLSTSSVGDPIITWNWDFGDASPQDTTQNPTHIYTTAGPVNVILTVSTAFCSASDTIIVTVESAPTAVFNPDFYNGCSPLSVNFNNTSSANAVNYFWDFGTGDTSLLANPTYIFVNNSGLDTTFNVMLIAQTAFGCVDTTYQSITVYPNPIASFTNNATLDCAPLNVNFTNTSTGGLTYQWDFGDGSPVDTNQNPFHTYNNLTQFIDNNIVTLIVTSPNGCTDTIIDSVLVFPEPQFGFSTNPDSGCSPLIVVFPSVLGAVQYQWDFGDGVTGIGPNPVHTYTNSGPNDTVYIVQLIATSPFGCTDTTYGQVLVFPIPTAAFTASPITQLYPNATVSFTNTSSGAITYLWDFGDTTSSTLQNPPNHTYSTWGTYTITLVVSNGNCFDTTTQIITINAPQPIADFLGPAQGCRPLDVQFVNNSQFADTYLWDFGDGGTSTQVSPSYTYFNAGTYTVTLTAFGPGGQDTQTQQQIIEVYQLPTAFFTVSPSTVFIPTQVSLFFNLSSFATTYLWDFGDGNTSTDVNPQHFYTQLGVYDIMLIATTPNNCIDTFILQSGVEAKSEGGIQIPNAFTPNPDGGNGGYYTAGDMDNDVFHPIIIGAEEYELNIFNKWGELLFISTDVNIGWDGYYRNELSKQDVYVYKIKVKYIDGRSESFVGDLTLLR